MTRNVVRTLIDDGRAPETISVAEISASAFRVARVPALRGRYLLPEDERPGAPDVIVIGHDEWVRRFNADPDIVGRSLLLGQHGLRGGRRDAGRVCLPGESRLLDSVAARPAAYKPRSGPAVHVFGRLAPGATLETAQAELTAITRHTATAQAGDARAPAGAGDAVYLRLQRHGRSAERAGVAVSRSRSCCC